MQAGGRRAWGAPPPPKPPSERRAVGEAAPGPQQAAQATKAAQQHRSPGKVVLPRLGGAAASPRGAHAAQQGRGLTQQQQAGEAPAPSRLKQHQQQGGTQHAAAQATLAPPQQQQRDLPPPQPPALSPPLPSAAWVSPQPLPSASPQELPLAAVAAPSSWLSREDEDVVLIGSAAPSFSQPLPQQAAAHHPAATHGAASQPPDSTSAAPGVEAEMASSPPRRASLLTTHLASEDLSLTALAAASRRASRYSSAASASSAASSARSSGGGGDGSSGGRAQGTGDAAAALPAAENDAYSSYAADFESESQSGGSGATCMGGASHPAAEGPTPQPAAASVPPPQRQAARLNSGELAVLRESILELQLGAGAEAGVPGGGRLSGAAPFLDDAATGGAGGVLQEIPDQVVLQELSSRLSRLDSQKRRVLLEVLSKLDVAAGGGAEGAAEAEPGGDTAGQLIADSLAGSRRASEMGLAAVLSPGREEGGPDADAEGVAAGVPAAAAPADAAGSEEEQQQQQPQQHSPSKGLLGKLAALRLGRTSGLANKAVVAAAAAVVSESSSGDGASQFQRWDHGGAPVVAAAGEPPPLPAGTGRQTSPPRQQQAVQAGSAGHKLQSMVQQRQRERSRLSLDGRHAAQQAQQAAQLPAAHGGGGSERSGGASPGDALSVFQDEDSPPSLAASPTVLALGAWQLLPDALDVATSDQASGASSRAAGAGSGGSRSGGGSAGFLIPCCPAGRVLELRISSTWGDQHYVGLAGIELFDASGQPISVRDPRRQVSATPHSINVLPEYGSDPRTPDKLLDGVCMTCDDAHVWLVPFTPGALHVVSVALDAPCSLGAVRVWNFNKSRIHSLRGARHVELALDGGVIFRGDLRQAPGSVSEAYQHAELILFTDDQAALAAIEQYDVRYSRQLAASPAGPDGGRASVLGGGGGPEAPHLDLVTASSLVPLTARGQLERTATLCLLPQGPVPTGRHQLVSGGRPLTAAFSTSPEAAAAAAAPRAPAPERRLSLASSRSSSTGAASAAASALICCQELALVLLDTWGDSHFVGLSGLQVLGGDGQPLPVAASRVAADPPDLNVFPGHSGDVRTADKLVDGTNNTTDDAHMWLAPVRRQLSAAVAAACQRHRRGLDRGTFPEAARPHNLLVLSLEGACAVSGLRVWNYNKSAADTARGVKRMVVLADGVEVSPPGGVLVRRAPGTDAFDFGQLIPLHTCWSAGGSGARAGRKRTTVQHGPGPGQPAAGQVGIGALPAASHQQRQVAGQQQQQPQPQPPQQPSPQQLVIHGESVAWACNMPDPAAALDYLQRAAALSKAAGPGAALVQQPGENFGTALPCGFSLRLVMLTTWGCPHYIGLSGIEVRDAVRGAVRIRPDQVHAVPTSVAILPGMAADVRTPDKLVDGVTSGVAQHSWLAPLDPQEGNSVLLVLDAPLLLGSIRVWNYGKTPSRGVQELECYLDEQLVWKGVLQRAPAALSAVEDFSQVLCFSEEAAQEAAAAARRRAVLRRPGAVARGSSTGARASGTGSLSGAPLGAEGVEEWCQRQEAVVLVNDGQFVAFPPDRGSGGGGAVTARPITAVVAA